MSDKTRDTDFMAELEAATHMRPAAPAMLMLFAIMGFIVFLLIWAGVAQIEELTRGEGQVVPSRDVQIVQSLEGGILGELPVKEGQLVKKGEVVLRISDVQFSSEERGTEAKFSGLIARKARLEAEASGKAFVVPPEIEQKNPQVAANELALYNSRQQELKNSYGILEDRISKASAGLSEVKAQIGRLSESKRHLQQELDLTREMVKNALCQSLKKCDLNGRLGISADR